MTYGPYLLGSYAFYGDPPAASTTYTVAVSGTVNSAPFSLTWSFTTQ
jgi:hypothetical protein